MGATATGGGWGPQGRARQGQDVGRGWQGGKRRAQQGKGNGRGRPTQYLRPRTSQRARQVIHNDTAMSLRSNQKLCRLR